MHLFGNCQFLHSCIAQEEFQQKTTFGVPWFLGLIRNPINLQILYQTFSLKCFFYAFASKLQFKAVYQTYDKNIGFQIFEASQKLIFRRKLERTYFFSLHLSYSALSQQLNNSLLNSFQTGSQSFIFFEFSMSF